jgi:hypothetical protein
LLKPSPKGEGLTPPRLGQSHFFSVEVLTWRGLATYYVLFFLHLETRRVTLAGITQHPTEEWMLQMARRAVDDIDGSLRSVRFVLHDRDTKILRFLSRHVSFRGCRAHPSASPESRFKCPRGTLCAHHQK